MGNDDNSRGGSNGFWQSIPGTLTSLAAVLTALAGLLAVAKPGLLSSSSSSGSSLKDTPSDHKTDSGSPVPVKTPPKVFSQGQLAIRGTFSCDLDAGAECDLGSADFFWEQFTEVKRGVAPQNGARFFVLGRRDFDSVGYEDLSRFHFSSETIDGSNLPSNRIPLGTVVAYKTKTGKPGKFLVEEYGYDLAIRWVTFAGAK